MLLCDRDIENLLNEGKILIEPSPLGGCVKGVAIDISLGNKFRVFIGHTASFFDLSKPKSEINTLLDNVMSKEIEIAEEKVFYLHPGELALGTTRESITLPSNIAGWLNGRSLFARLGLMIHLTAHRIDPGWSGCIVLEFFNAGKLSLALRPGTIIGALSFELLSDSVNHPYNRF